MYLGLLQQFCLVMIELLPKMCLQRRRLTSFVKTGFHWTFNWCLAGHICVAGGWWLVAQWHPPTMNENLKWPSSRGQPPPGPHCTQHIFINECWLWLVCAGQWWLLYITYQWYHGQIQMLSPSNTGLVCTWHPFPHGHIGHWYKDDEGVWDHCHCLWWKLQWCSPLVCVRDTDTSLHCPR